MWLTLCGFSNLAFLNYIRCKMHCFTFSPNGFLFVGGVCSVITKLLALLFFIMKCQDSAKENFMCYRMSVICQLNSIHFVQNFLKKLRLGPGDTSVPFMQVLLRMLDLVRFNQAACWKNELKP